MIYTIGHSSHDFSKFVKVLKDLAISTIVDVRSTPYSWNEGFRLEALEKNSEIGYEFLGDKLGGRSVRPEFFNDKGRVIYSRLAETDEFQDGLAQVQKRSKENDIALMCSEKHPLTCHRTILIARKLKEAGNEVKHILILNNVKAPVEMTHGELINEFTKVINDAAPSNIDTEAIGEWLGTQDIRQFINVLDAKVAEKHGDNREMNGDLFAGENDEANNDDNESSVKCKLNEVALYDWLEKNFAYRKKP